MNYTDIIEVVAKEIKVSPDIVDKVYKAFWLYIRNSIQELPLKQELTEEEFLNLRPNFNIPSLGKLVCTYQRYLGVKEKFKYIRKLKHEKAKENQASLQ